MDNEPINIKYELSKSPTPIPIGNFYNDNDIGRFMEKVHATSQSNVVHTVIPNSWQMYYQNTLPGQYPQSINAAQTLIATPPLSPLDISMQQHQQQLQSLQPRPQDMPLLTAMLANNYNQNHQPFSYTPPSYIVNIPCFLCQEPFTTIESLRDHLTRHAIELGSRTQISSAFASPSSSVEHNPMQPTGAALWESIGQPTDYNRKQSPFESLQFTCELCSRSYPMESQRDNCLAQHSVAKKRQIKPASPFKCLLCKKSYKRPGNLFKHNRLLHTEAVYPVTPESLIITANNDLAPPSTEPIPTAAAATTNPALAKATFPLPIQSTAENHTDNDTKKRCVWTTKLINAVAAANYSPAKESASKYMPPSEAVRERFEFNLQTKPKKKYPLRSPYSNPNLWVDYDAYIE